MTVSATARSCSGGRRGVRRQRSITGNVTLLAGQYYTQTGSDILAPAGDITIQAQDIRTNEARETRKNVTTTLASLSDIGPDSSCRGSR